MPRTKPQEIKPDVLELGQLGRRRRRRGGEGRAARGRGVPARPQALPQARREGAEGHPAARPARHGQDAAGQGGRATSRTRTSSPSRPPSFVEMFAGLGAARIRRLFRQARKARARRSSSSTSSTPSAATRGNDISGEKDQTLNQLLVELDGFGDRRRRRGDRRLQPAREARPGAAAPGPLRPPDLRLAARPRRAAQAILDVHTRGKPLADDVDLELIARQTSGLTGADLANICNEAAIFAGRDAPRRDRARATSRPRSSASSPACSRAA